MRILGLEQDTIVINDRSIVSLFSGATMKLEFPASKKEAPYCESYTYITLAREKWRKRERRSTDVCRENENTVSPLLSLSLSRDASSLAWSSPAEREITANNVRGLLSYRDTLVLWPLRLGSSIAARCSNWVSTSYLTYSSLYLCDEYLSCMYTLVREEREVPNKIRARPTRHVHRQGGIEKLSGNPDGLSRPTPSSRLSLSFSIPVSFPPLRASFCSSLQALVPGAFAGRVLVSFPLFPSFSLAARPIKVFECR